MIWGTAILPSFWQKITKVLYVSTQDDGEYKNDETLVAMEFKQWVKYYKPAIYISQTVPEDMCKLYMITYFFLCPLNAFSLKLVNLLYIHI